MAGFDQIGDNIRKISKGVPLNILVWGPGDPGQQASSEERKPFEKRIQIRDVLESEFQNSEVFFSEDQEANEMSSWVHGVLGRETLQAASADVLLILNIGRGTDLEIDHFVLTFSWIRGKTYLFISDRYRSSESLVTEAYKYLHDDQVIYYSQDEFDSCQLATRIAVQIVHTAAMCKLLKGLGNG